MGGENSKIETSSPPLTPQNTEEITDKASPSNGAGHKRNASIESETNPDDVAKKMKFVEYTSEELQCGICTELFIEARTLACAHTFCKICIEEWRKKENKCPVCRQRITKLSPTFVIDNVIEKLIESSSDAIKEQRHTIVEERNARPAPRGRNTRRRRPRHNRASIALPIANRYRYLPINWRAYF